LRRVSFPFVFGQPVVEVLFARADGTTAARRLLVDSGFTGESSFVLGTTDFLSLGRQVAADSTVSGAVSGRQSRTWVMCLVPGVEFSRRLVAICTDVTPLRLPAGIDGLAGLRFLEQFSRWGAEPGDRGGRAFWLQA
jgi:hypothetical protein